ncbi:MAG: helix-turn-helix domain-containing protein [Bacteroidia bacterium]
MHQQDENIFSKKELSAQIGLNVRRIRKNAKLSQSELGLRCGKDKQHIELIENAKTTPTIYTLYLIAKALGVSLEEICKVIDKNC